MTEAQPSSSPAPRPAPTVPTGGGAGIPSPGPAVDLRLDGNQGSRPGVELLHTLAADPETLRGYPAGDALERVLAARHDKGPESIAIGAGADEILDRICRAVLARGRTAIVPVPTFEMLERYVALTGAEVLQVPWTEGAWPQAQVIGRITPNTALIAIVSPNNPTGLHASPADVAAVAAAAPHALVLVDAAYAEYGEPDLSAEALSWPNVVLVRTLSKAWGLAGLRVGYAVAAPTTARWLRSVGSPFTCGRFARAAACARLATGGADTASHVATVRAERAATEALLAELGVARLPSQANFVFAMPPDPVLLRDQLAGLGIAVRAFGWPQLERLRGGVRISMPGDAASLRRLHAALRAALRPEAVVLDLDGVLALVEERRALASPDRLAAIAARLPIAVVTSCPRRLCQSLLERHGFAPHVRAAVVAEDGPGKPDPFPVRLALERVGAKCGWMLGDNTVDVLAARRAGVVPFAIAPDTGAPGGAALRQALLDVGAARLVAGVDELAALLPR